MQAVAPNMSLTFAGRVDTGLRKRLVEERP